jgi:hypothetical protein
MRFFVAPCPHQRKEIMGEKEEQEYRDAVDAYEVEAAKNAINAFNEGYLLGMKHAEAVFGETKDENQGK